MRPVGVTAQRGSAPADGEVMYTKADKWALSSMSLLTLLLLSGYPLGLY